jgi:hypothetical protein
MPLGVALSELRYDLRAEIYQSLLPAHGISAQDMQNLILERSQRELWNQYAWPHLRYRVDQLVPAHTRYVEFPPSAPFEAVLRVWYKENTQWLPMGYDFTNWIYNAQGGEGQEGYPPQLWRNNVQWDSGSGLTDFTGQLELWPVPNKDVTLRFEAQAPLNPLKIDTDTCMIDSTAIVLTAATELLGAQKSEVAQLKGQKANAYIKRLLARSGANKRATRALGQGNWVDKTPTPYIDYIPMTST